MSQNSWPRPPVQPPIAPTQSQNDSNRMPPAFSSGSGIQPFRPPPPPPPPSLPQSQINANGGDFPRPQIQPFSSTNAAGQRPATFNSRPMSSAPPRPFSQMSPNTSMPAPPPAATNLNSRPIQSTLPPSNQPVHHNLQAPRPPQPISVSRPLPPPPPLPSQTNTQPTPQQMNSFSNIRPHPPMSSNMMSNQSNNSNSIGFNDRNLQQQSQMSMMRTPQPPVVPGSHFNNNNQNTSGFGVNNSLNSGGGQGLQAPSSQMMSQTLPPPHFGANVAQAPNFNQQPTFGTPSPMGIAKSHLSPNEFYVFSLSNASNTNVISPPGTQQIQNRPPNETVTFPRPSIHKTDIESPIGTPENANPIFMKLTTHCAPRSSAVKERFQIPYGAIIQPLAEDENLEEVPIVKLGSYGIVRCRRCRTYMNPFVLWLDGGRRWQCNMCRAMNDTPTEFFCTVDNFGKRRDADMRPEVSVGSVEYVAPPEYMVRAPMPATYFFLIDVSHDAVNCGILHVISDAIKASLNNLQGDDRKRIGFMTFDKSVHFYDLKNSKNTPKMIVMSEIEDPFVPQPDDLLVNLEESREMVESFLDNLPQTLSKSNSIESAMGSALQASFLLLNQLGAKVIMFLGGIPTLGPGKIRKRDNQALMGTDKEIMLRNPENSFYKKFAAECSRAHITVDVFSLNQKYTDLASIISLPRYTGGQVYHYPGFNFQKDSNGLFQDIKRNLTRTTGWEAVMRLRCSKGLRISSFSGHFFIRSSDLLALPTVDPDKGYAIQMTHDETVVDGDFAYLQCALLYTASCGERRIRVHTLKFPVVNEVTDMFKYADTQAIAIIFAKLAVEKSLTSKLEETRRAIEGRLISVLREYRTLHSMHFRGLNNLACPDNLKNLPVLTLGLLKHPSITSGLDGLASDERMSSGFFVVSSTLKNIIQALYPLMYLLDTTNEEWGKPDPNNESKIKMPWTCPSSSLSLDSKFMFLLNTVQQIYLWIGNEVATELIIKSIGIDLKKENPIQQNPRLSIEPCQDNPLSRRICALVNEMRREGASYKSVSIVFQGSVEEMAFLSMLVEDRIHSIYGYHDFMHYLHRQIGIKA